MKNIFWSYTIPCSWDAENDDGLIANIEAFTDYLKVLEYSQQTPQHQQWGTISLLKIVNVYIKESPRVSINWR